GGVIAIGVLLLLAGAAVLGAVGWCCGRETLGDVAVRLCNAVICRIAGPWGPRRAAVSRRGATAPGRSPAAAPARPLARRAASGARGGSSQRPCTTGRCTTAPPR